MTLPDWIIEALCQGSEMVKPYNPENLNPASIDLTLGRMFVNRSEIPVGYLLNQNSEIAKPGERFEADQVTLIPGVALLATTAEYVKIPAAPTVVENPFYSALDPQNGQPAKFLLHPMCASVFLKSSAARRGLDHALAGWVDPGFEGELTLEFHSHTETVLEAGKKYVQLVPWMMFAGPIKGYQETGRYFGQVGPTEAKEMK